MSQRLRVLTANLWNGGADPEALARRLQELAVDVCAVQELTPSQARAITSILPHGKLEPAIDHQGMGIALRHPGEVSTLALTGRPARVARLEAGAWPRLRRAVEVLNVHVWAPHSKPWRAFGIRRAQIRELLGYLERRPHPGRVLVGDLNATPLWPAYRRLAERLRDAAQLHASRRGERPPSTWGPGYRSPRLLRIDHALVGDLEVTHCEVVRIEGSDHSGVLVELDPHGEG